MKYLFTLFFIFILDAKIQAQETLINETFETGWTGDSNVIPVENEEGTPAANLKLQGWGDGFTFTVVNDAGNGANSSDYFAKMNRGGTANYAVIQRLVEATIGDVYEYNISLKPDVAGQAGSLKLEVIDLANNNNVVAGPVKPTGGAWNDLTLSYTAAATQNYAFRITKNWGNAGASFDNISLVCTGCSTASVSDVNDFQFNIYPTPAKDVISFQSELPLERVEIFSLTGSKVLSQLNNVKQVEVGNLAKGIYMLKATATDGKVATQKLIKY
jgi:hypothetical protein